MTEATEATAHAAPSASLDSLQIADAQCAAVAVAPRVTLADIETAIAETFYFNAHQAAVMCSPKGRYVHPHLSTLTICLVVMKNGFVVIGKAAPASPENFNADIGRKFAYEDAVRQLWPLMGFALRDRLSEPTALQLAAEARRAGPSGY